MSDFIVNEELEKDSLCLLDLELSRVYIKNDKENPWFVLVPRKKMATELVDLNHEEQCMLMEEVSLVSEFLKSHYNPNKLNVASLGNVVSQLHVHVIARFNDDRAWPAPLFGTGPRIYFDDSEMLNIKSNFEEFIN